MAIAMRDRIPKYWWANGLLWARQLSLKDRLAWRRDADKATRKFLPVTPIWGVGRKREGTLT